jgi:SAM-dependent methyltransferase
MLAAADKQNKFMRMLNFWMNKVSERGDGYVGRVGEGHDLQRQKIEDILRTKFDKDTFYYDAMDFGCGWGRFEPFLSDFCGHIWAVDLLEDMVQRASSVAPLVTPFRMSYPVSFPLSKPKFDLLWACLVFQHITDESLFEDTLNEIRRVLKPGARILILDNAKDRAPHVRPRDPQRFAQLLGMQPGWQHSLVTINNRPQDHWMIDGVKG